MSHDVGLQRAILASLQSSSRPAPAPSRSFAPAPTRSFAPRRDIAPVPRNNATLTRSQSFGGSGAKFSSTRNDAVSSGNNRRFSDYRKSPQSRSGQSLGTLAREGFKPSTPGVSDRGSLQSPKARVGSTTSVSSPPSSGGTTSRRIPAPTHSQSFVSTESVSGGTPAKGWTRICGKGSVKSQENKDGSVFVLSGDSAGFYFVKPDNSGSDIINTKSYMLKLEMKVVRTNVADEQFFYVILGTRSVPGNSTPDYTALCVNARNQSWRLERLNAGSLKVFSEKPDKSLKPNEYRLLLVEVSGSTVSVSADGKSIFSGIDVGDANVSGPVGVGVYRSKAMFRDWDIEAGGSVEVKKKKDLAPYTGDDPELVEMIQRDLIMRDLGVEFDDIASLQDAKRLLNEAVVLPLVIPEFFIGLREPWKGVLLFGPPGTGKTMLAKAVASMSDTTFFNCTASTLVSKWRGDSEKLVRVLFNMARHYAPSIIFFDEFDSLMSSRGNPNEHEASRRFKSELLTQIDGLISKASEGNVMVLATSNCPWDLDEAMRRRLEKRIYIPIPDYQARTKMFELILKDVKLAPDVTFSSLAKKTETFSGADIQLLCREASMMGMRKLIAGKNPVEIKKLRDTGALDYQTSMDDFDAALKTTQSSVCLPDIQNYEKWNKEFGSV